MTAKVKSKSRCTIAEYKLRILKAKWDVDYLKTLEHHAKTEANAVRFEKQNMRI